jgi:Folliculin-interacting protein C-terminus
MDDVNGLSLQADVSDEEQEGPQLLELPIPISEITKISQPHNDFAASLIGYSHSTYNADLVVQACTQDMAEWKDKLKRDLILAAHQPLFEKEVAEAICILANVEKWYFRSSLTI